MASPTLKQKDALIMQPVHYPHSILCNERRSETHPSTRCAPGGAGLYPVLGHLAPLCTELT